jgi:hypothetical protein
MADLLLRAALHIIRLSRKVTAAAPPADPPAVLATADEDANERVPDSPPAVHGGDSDV